MFSGPVVMADDIAYRRVLGSSPFLVGYGLFIDGGGGDFWLGQVTECVAVVGSGSVNMSVDVMPQK